MIDDAMLRRFWLAVAWFGVGLIIFLSLTPSPPDIDLGKFSDKYEHVAAYAVLMLWFCQIYLSTVQRGCMALLLVVLGVALEFIQRATGYREFEVADMVAGASGVCLGWLLAPPRLPNCLALARSLLSRRRGGSGGSH
jgi:VanZ family protein